ncbi:MAG: metallophosphoesterase [Deltaproteobacteria bacterium]|nr:metallophosphoesterase [Deltaproteobacteria bacterium]
MPLPRRARIRLSIAGIAVAATVASPRATAQAPTPFAVTPYLQNLQPTSAIVRFELRSPAPATVEVLADGAQTTRFESATTQRFHSVHLTGLRPATTVSYQVRVGAATSDRGTFTTAPAQDASPSFSFTLYGDSRSGSAAHASVVREIEALPSDLLVGTGDIVASGKDREEWLEFFSIEQRLLRDRCLFSVIGNHELVGKGPAARQPWIRYFAPTDDARGAAYYTFRWSNTRFFMLDAMDSWDGAQAQWLRSELDRAEHEPGLVHRFVVTHHSPFSSGPHGPSVAFVSKGMVDELVRHHVELIMAGHDHLYERGETSGVKYIISGGAGAPLYSVKKTQPGSAFTASDHHFVQMQVDGAVVVATAHALGKGVLERCSFRAGHAWECSEGADAAATAVPSPSSPPPVASSSAPAVPMPPASARPVGPPPAPKCTCDVPGSRENVDGSGVLLAALALGATHRRSRRRARA